MQNANRLEQLLSKKKQDGSSAFLINVFYCRYKEKYICTLLYNDSSLESVLDTLKQTRAYSEQFFNFVNLDKAKWIPIVVIDNPATAFNALEDRLSALSGTNFAKLSEGLKLLNVALRLPVQLRIEKLTNVVPTDISKVIIA